MKPIVWILLPCKRNRYTLDTYCTYNSWPKLRKGQEINQFKITVPNVITLMCKTHNIPGKMAFFLSV